MNLDRFAAIVDAWGGSPDRWPEAERAAAVAFMNNTPEAQRLAAEAKALDRALDAAETAPATRELEDRILASMPVARFGRVGQGVLGVFNWSRLIPAAAFACSLALGVAAGTQIPGLVGLDDESLALQVASNAMTPSAGDGNFFGDSE
ncbi:MAG: hypothetical protein GC190_00355 [Alphaproteobacteria bacterium]|nr:hypothetical protein [Alphaproteobacteria bacterium]